MTLEQALSFYNLPFQIIERIDCDGSEMFRLFPTSSSGTVGKLKSRLKELKYVTGESLDIVETEKAFYIRKKSKPVMYKWTDYNGYIDNQSNHIPFIVGFSNGSIIMDSLEDARHLLVSGTTGSGKSVFLHDLITTFCCNPNVYLYLVDCKQVEFSIYKDVARVTAEVSGDQSALSFSALLVEEMGKRFSQMEKDGVNNFPDFQKLHPNEKRFVFVIDELADLLSDKQAERVLVPRILRLAQKGRAAGFHVILSTQRPDSSIINGTLKGNIPTRLAFRTISAIDSRIILDQTGAERLNGNGDGLYLRNGAFDLERIQAPFISLDDIRKIKTA